MAIFILSVCIGPVSIIFFLFHSFQYFVVFNIYDIKYILLLVFMPYKWKSAHFCVETFFLNFMSEMERLCKFVKPFFSLSPLQCYWLAIISKCTRICICKTVCGIFSCLCWPFCLFYTLSLIFYAHLAAFFLHEMWQIHTSNRLGALKLIWNSIFFSLEVKYVYCACKSSFNYMFCSAVNIVKWSYSRTVKILIFTDIWYLNNTNANTFSFSGN